MKTTLALLVFAFGAASWADDPGVVVKEATGEAAVVAGDVAKATDQATQNALREAVAQSAGTLIQADTLTKNSTLVRDEVAAHTSGFVKSYEVTAKSQDKGVVKVTVKAQVLTKEIDKDLAVTRSIIKRLGGTKLMIYTQETLIDPNGVITRGEQLSTQLVSTFRNDGWRIIDEKGTSAGRDEKVQLTAGVSQGHIDPKDARFDGIDYVVYGTISLRFVPPKSGGTIPEVSSSGEQQIFFVEGQYDLSMLETKTGRNLAKIAGKLGQQVRTKADLGKIGVSYEFTAKNLCETRAPEIAAALRAPVIEYLRDQIVNGAEVELKVTGLPNLKAVDELQREVEAIHAVKNVKVTGDFKNGAVTYTVHVDGTALDLGKALDDAKVLKEKKKLKTTAVSGNLVEVAIAK